MRKILALGVNNIEKVKNERIKGVSFLVCPKNADGEIIAINDFNQIDIKLARKTANGNETVKFNGRLLDYLTALYAQKMVFENIMTVTSRGYLIPVNFGGTLVVTGEEEFIVELYIRDEAFADGLVKANSTVELETIPSVKTVSSILPIVKSISIGNGETSISESIGSSVVKIVLATDFTAAYLDSEKAQIKDVTIESSNVTVKSSSETILIMENIHAMNDVDYKPKNTILFNATNRSEMLSAVTVKANFSKAVDSDARLLVVKAVQF